MPQPLLMDRWVNGQWVAKLNQDVAKGKQIEAGNLNVMKF
jgi:hypothetical protein